LLARLERARGDFDQAEAILAALAPGPELLLERAELWLARSQPERALESFELAASELPVFANPLRAEALAGKGRALLLLDRHDQAQVELERALAIWDELAPQGHPRSIPIL